ncbi:M28 family peptidase [Yinghuangia seranimata]|uniref:M28 family peptidase n=1 Tax=Yinghuangia seranimata TaxID=408067 RepID=UPI00248B0E85|nr:M28 family peptidase [Yinghuangia seranimata]MDI2129559.1 M28 family peptidase [Yinghuangia seranimata]
MTPPQVRRPTDAELRKVIEPLALLDRLPTSPGEHEAAERIAERLAEAGARAVVEREPAYPSYARPIGALTAAATAAGLLTARRGRSLLGAAVGALAVAGIADDISYRRQYARRLLSGHRRTAANVVATVGDDDAPRTLVVMAHHDAAPTGAVFDQRLARHLARRYPAMVDRATENPPMWWPVLAGPALVAAGCAAGSRGLRRAGTVLSAVTTAALTQIGRSTAVPGANDNLTAVAVLVALADTFRERPVPGLRVILFSAGAEEALQEGVRGFAHRHFPELPLDTTWFLNLDTLGSGNLVLLDAEGPVTMEDYDAAFGDQITALAADHGVRLLRGLRSRSSTDGVVPMRHGYRTATIVSIDDDKLIPHYHLHTDLPEHVDFTSVADAAVVAEAVARDLAAT